ncbi:MAG: chromate efflux transporter [Actinomycetota bacterium]|nr:chromate efflux transporter [Actinomycetota bacterium]
MAPASMPSHGISLSGATRVWAYIGLNSFGGPAGQISVMHRELVETRHWISERRFLHALNYCMVLPGPEAQQLATYVGWLMHGVRGGVIAGSLFVIPGFVAMLALSIGYAVLGEVPLVSGLLFGLQAAVVAIVVQAAIRIGRRTLRSPALVLVATCSFLAIALVNVPFPAIIAVAGLFGWLAGRVRPRWLPLGGRPDEPRSERPALLADDERVDRATALRAFRAALVALALWLVPVLALALALGTEHVLTQEAFLFSKAAVVTFGGAYAVLGYVAQQAVDRYGWVTPQDMMVGLGLAETTPGPLIMVVQFVGFLAAYNNPGDLPPVVAGVLGSVVTVWVTFVPCFLFIFLGAPFVERLRDNDALRHALTAVGAAVTGVVLDLALWFAMNTVFGSVQDRSYGPFVVPVPDLSSIQWASVGLSVLAAVLVFRFRLGTLKVLAVIAGLGAALAVAGVT